MVMEQPCFCFFRDCSAHLRHLELVIYGGAADVCRAEHFARALAEGKAVAACTFNPVIGLVCTCMQLKRCPSACASQTSKW
jgi:hypothetical protein